MLSLAVAGLCRTSLAEGKWVGFLKKKQKNIMPLGVTVVKTC